MSLSDLLCTLYPNCMAKKGVNISFADAVDACKTGKIYGKDHSGTIVALRNESEHEKRKDLKMRLPAVLLSGISTSRTQIEKYNGLVQIDIDSIGADEAKELKERFRSDPFALMVTISPSGNGLKVVYQVNTGVDIHKRVANIVYDHIEDNYGIKVDRSVSDVVRLMFLTDDPDCLYNPDALVYKVNLNKEAVELPKLPSAQSKMTLGKDVRIEKAISYTHKKYGEYVRGNRNNIIHGIASLCNNSGISRVDCEEALESYELSPMRKKRAIDSAYKREEQFGTFRQTDTSAKPQQIRKEKQHPFEETPYLPKQVYRDLPMMMQNVLGLEDDQRQKDILFLSLSTISSAAMTKVTTVYDGNDISPCLYTFIVAPPASGKSGLDKAKKAASIVDGEIEKRSQLKIAKYKRAKKLCEGSGNCEDLVEPKRQSFLLSGNASGAGLVEDIKNNDGKGLVMETEADSVAKADQSTWGNGNISQMYRQGFHHEDIRVSRKEAKVNISKPAFAVCLSGTPNQIGNMITGVEDGLMSRFIFYAFIAKPVWRDPFALKNEELKEAIGAYGAQLIGLIDHYDRNSLTVKLSKDQMRAHNDLFEPLLSGLEPTDYLGGSIKRLGIIVVRFALIFTAIRIYEKGEGVETTTCLDIDYQNALSLCEPFLEHTKSIFSFLGVSKAMDKHIKLYNLLSDEFTTSDAVEKGKSIGFNRRKVERMLTDNMQGRIYKQSHGVYRKNEFE